MSLPPMFVQSASSLAMSAAAALRIQEAVLEMRQTTQELHRLNMCMWGMRTWLQREGLDLATRTFPPEMAVGDVQERGIDILNLVEKDVKHCTLLLRGMHLRWRGMQEWEETRVQSERQSFERQCFERSTLQRQCQDVKRRIQKAYRHI